MTCRALHVDGSFLAYSRFKAGGADAMSMRFREQLDRLRLAHDPGVIIVAWDSLSGTLWRRQILAAYKAGRVQKEADYNIELEQLRRRLREDGVVQASSPRGEADDVIATLVRTTPGPHIIYSADKDLLQLVEPGVTMIKAAAGRRAGSDTVVTAADLASDQFHIRIGATHISGLDARGWGDLLALAGDTADNIPGVLGIGPGRALRLLRACPELVDLVLAERGLEAQAAIAARDPTLVKYVIRCIEHRRDLELGKALVTLRTLDDIETT